MKKLKKVMKKIARRAIAVALVATLAVGNAIAGGFYFGPPGKVFSSSTKTNAIQNWPNAIGSNAVVAASTAFVDVTNVTVIPVGGADNLSLEFVGTFTNGVGGSGATSNLVIRVAWSDWPANTPLTATNGTSSNPLINLWSWTIPITVASGNAYVDVTTNLTVNYAMSPVPPLSHGNWYIYDMTWNVVTNGSPYLTNYAVYYSIK